METKYKFNFSYLQTKHCATPLLFIYRTYIIINEAVFSYIGRPDFFSIGYDKEQQAICFSVFKSGQPHYSFFERNQKGRFRISAAPIVRGISRRTGIDFSKSKSFLPVYKSSKAGSHIVFVISEKFIKTGG